MTAPRYAVDWQRLADSLEMACHIRGVSLRDVAAEVGISPSGLSRLRSGQHLSADATAALTAWLFPKDVPFWFKAVES